MVERQHERLDVRGEMRGEVMTYQPMTITQISEGGARVDTAFALHLDTVHQFRLSLNDLSVIVRGRIAYSRISRVENQRGLTYQSGVEFVDLSEHARLALASFMQEIRRRQEGP